MASWDELETRRRPGNDWPQECARVPGGGGRWVGVCVCFHVCFCFSFFLKPMHEVH